MRSLLGPLVLGLVLSLAVVLGVQWSLFRADFDAMIVDYIAHELTQDAEEVFGSLAVLPSGETRLALTHFDPPFLEPHSGRYFQVVVDDGTVLRSPSLQQASLDVPAVSPGHRRVTHLDGPLRQDLLLSAVGYEYAGHAITVGVAADLEPVRARFGRVLGRYAQVSLLMFDVDRLERGEIEQLGERVPMEVLPLVREVNRSLALMAQRLSRRRESLANLAHALKGPLTVLRHMADDTHAQRDPAAFAREMGEQVDALRARIDRELRRARVAGGRGAGAPLDVAAEIGALAETLGKINRERGLAIECRIDPGARFGGDREDLLELAGNLLDNACKWARSRVRVTARADGALVLCVEDDGPGCPPGDLARLAERGVRLDESTEGHGLGLAIARSIADSYDAELGFGRSAALGGFAASVTFPAA